MSLSLDWISHPRERDPNCAPQTSGFGSWTWLASCAVRAVDKRYESLQASWNRGNAGPVASSGPPPEEPIGSRDRWTDSGVRIKVGRRSCENQEGGSGESSFANQSMRELPTTPNRPVTAGPPSTLTGLVEFCRFARDNGFDSGLRAVIDSVRAVEIVDYGRLDAFRCALRATLCTSKREWDVFDRLFDAFWYGVRIDRPRQPIAPSCDPLLNRRRSQRIQLILGHPASRGAEARQKAITGASGPIAWARPTSQQCRRMISASSNVFRSDCCAGWAFGFQEDRSSRTYGAELICAGRYERALRMGANGSICGIRIVDR